MSASEYQVFALTNAARLNANFYLSNIGGRGSSMTCSPPQNPQTLDFDSRLQASARSHSNSMAALTCFDHNTCGCHGNGCDFSTRIHSFGIANNVMPSENIAQASSGNALTFVNMWLSSTGHCENIMGPSTRMGNAITNGYATQDFTNEPSQRWSQVFMGAHLSGRGFILIGDSSISSVQVIFNGKSYPLTNVGGYHFASASNVASCSTFYFSYEKGKTMYWPVSGKLLAQCGNNFQAGSLNNAGTVNQTKSPGNVDAQVNVTPLNGVGTDSTNSTGSTSRTVGAIMGSFAGLGLLALLCFGGRKAYRNGYRPSYNDAKRLMRDAWQSFRKSVSSLCSSNSNNRKTALGQLKRLNSEPQRDFKHVGGRKTLQERELKLLQAGVLHLSETSLPAPITALQPYGNSASDQAYRRPSQDLPPVPPPKD